MACEIGEGLSPAESGLQGRYDHPPACAIGLRQQASQLSLLFVPAADRRNGSSARHEEIRHRNRLCCHAALKGRSVALSAGPILSCDTGVDRIAIEEHVVVTDGAGRQDRLAFSKSNCTFPGIAGDPGR